MIIKKIGFFIAVIVLIFVINNFIHSIYSLWQKNNVITHTKIELEKEKKENQELKKQLSEVNNQQFVEEEARDKLFMIRPGEGIILLPTIDMPITPTPRPVPSEPQPDWKKWWNLFF